VQLEQGIESWNESDQNVPPPLGQAPPKPRTAADLINSMTALIPEEREWLLRHQDLVNDPTRVSELQGTYFAAQRQGLARGTPEYFRFFEERLGVSDGQTESRTPAPSPRRMVQAQAPVSRGTTSLTTGRHQDTGGRITLSKEHWDAARWSGVDENTYARNLKKLMDLKRQSLLQRILSVPPSEANLPAAAVATGEWSRNYKAWVPGSLRVGIVTWETPQATVAKDVARRR
jgi:hypothetical protein